MGHPRVLVIEDSEADIQVLQMMLGKHLGEMVFETLPDGAAALNFIRECRQNPPDATPCVIVLDVHLPKHDGLTVLEALREAPVLCDVSVVVLSSTARPSTVAEVAQQGAHFRTKPNSLEGYDELAEYIAGVCRGVLV